MLHLLERCGSDDAPAVRQGPSVLEQVVEAPPVPLPHDALFRIGGSPWGVFGASGEVGHVVALESGRWATPGWRGWELWDPAQGLVRVVQPSPRPDGDHGRGHTGVTPDGAWLVTADRAVRFDPDVIVTEPRTAKYLEPGGHWRSLRWFGRGVVQAPEVVPPGRSPDGALEWSTGRLSRSDGSTVAIALVCVPPQGRAGIGPWWSPDGRRAACAGRDAVAVLDRNGAEVARVELPILTPERGSFESPAPPRILDAVWSSDGRVVLLHDRRSYSVAWHVDTGAVVPIDLPRGARGAPSADGTVIIAADSVGIGLFDAATGHRLNPVPAHLPVHAVLGPEGEVAVQLDDGTASTWTADGEPLARWTWGPRRNLTWSADGVCGGGPDDVACFDPVTGAERVRLPVDGWAYAAGARAVTVVPGTLRVDDVAVALPGEVRLYPDISADGTSARLGWWVVDLVAGRAVPVPPAPDGSDRHAQRVWDSFGGAHRTIASVRAGRVATIEPDGSVVVSMLPDG